LICTEVFYWLTCQTLDWPKYF